MRAVLQRVARASVEVEGRTIGQIGRGLVVFVGVGKNDRDGDAVALCDRCATLRVFDDNDGRMNISALDAGVSMLIVSQFTLYGDTRRGRRPSYSEAAPPEIAESLYDRFTERARELLGPHRVATGQFRAMMNVSLVNDGPVTLIVESTQHD